MKLKRFNAPDIRQAIGLVRDELGPNAVIISNRSTANGVEIIAAMDYDEALMGSTEIVDSKSSKTQAKAAYSTSKTKASAKETVEKVKDTYWKNPVAPVSEKQPDNERRQNKEAKNRDVDKTTLEWLNHFNESTDEPEEIAKPVNKASNAVSMEKAPESDELKGVWNELHSLRNLLERQLSTLAWGDLVKRYPQRAKVMRHLLEMGLSPAVCRRLLQDAKEESSFDLLWRKVLTQFSSKISSAKEDVILNGGIFALVGPTGVGKTTTIAKMAARYALTHGTKGIALITTDNYRVGAQEQLRTYGRIMGAPVLIANDAQELKKTLKTLYDKQLVLIDTAGMSQRDLRITEQFAMLSEGSTAIKTYLVLSAAAQLQVLDETVKAYQKVILDGCILTKLDECSTLGGALSAIYHHQIPIAYVSDGQRVPEDLHLESSVALVKRAIGMMQKLNHRLEDEVVEMAFGGVTADELS